MVAITIAMALLAGSARASDPSELDIALGLAKMLQSARAVISANQDRINDPKLGDKGLSPDAVLKLALANFAKASNLDAAAIDSQSRYGRLLQAQMQAIREVMADNQKVINEQGVGFKGFVPAVFGRLVTEQFREIAGREAEIKVTAPVSLVRNRKARPDAWERRMIETRLAAPSWPEGKVLADEAEQRGRKAYRVLVPEYYGQGCLSCHGEPKGALDITGYPKEGGALGDLGGVISVTLYR